MKSSKDILDDVYETINSLEKTLNTMRSQTGLKTESKEKIVQNLSALQFFHDRVKSIGIFTSNGNTYRCLQQ